MLKTLFDGGLAFTRLLHGILCSGLRGRGVVTQGEDLIQVRLLELRLHPLAYLLERRFTLRRAGAPLYDRVPQLLGLLGRHDEEPLDEACGRSSLWVPFRAPFR